METLYAPFSPPARDVDFEGSDDGEDREENSSQSADDEEVLVSIQPFRDATRAGASLSSSECVWTETTSSSSKGGWKRGETGGSGDSPSRLSALPDAGRTARAILSSDSVGNEGQIFMSMSPNRGQLQTPGLAPTSSNRDLMLQKMLRKQSIKAFQLLGGGQNVSHINEAQFAKALQLLGVINSHTDRDDKAIISKLVASAFSYNIQKSQRRTKDSFNKEERGVDLECFSSFVEAIFNVSIGSDDRVLQELLQDLRFRKHMNRRRHISATARLTASGTASQTLKAHMRSLSTERDFYSERYAEMKATLEADEMMDLTFKPVTNLRKPPVSKPRTESPVQTESGRSTSRPKDRRSSMQREFDDHCKFQPSASAGNPFASKSAIHLKGHFLQSSPPAPPRLPSPRKIKAAAASHAISGWGTFHPSQLQWLLYELPPVGTPVFYFDSQRPPDFVGGTYCHVEIEVVTVATEQLAVSPSPPPHPPSLLPPMGHEKHHSQSPPQPPVPPVSPAPPAPPAPPLDNIQEVATPSRAQMKITIPAKKAPAQGREEREEEVSTPGASGWDAVLQEMARKRGGMGLTSVLKKSEKKERLPRSRLAGSAKSDKRQGEDDPEFTDVIDELKYRLERMKRGHDGDKDGNGEKVDKIGTRSKKKSALADLDLNMTVSEEKPPLVSKVLFPDWGVANEKEGLWRQATVVAAVPPAEDQPLGEKRWAIPPPASVPIPPPIPSVWPPMPLQAGAGKPEVKVAAVVPSASLPSTTSVPSSAVPSTSFPSVATTVNVSVSKTLPLPYGLFVPMDATLYRILPSHIQAAGALSLDFRHNLASSLLESSIDEDEDATEATTVNTGESRRRNGGAKKSADALPIPSSFFGAIQRLQMAHETRDRNREREKQRELRYYDTLPPDGTAKARELTVPKEFSFASRRRDQQLFTYRKPQEVSRSSLLPNSYYLPTKVLLNSTNQDLSGAIFMSTLRQPVDPLPILCVPAAVAVRPASFVSEKPLKNEASVVIPDDPDKKKSKSAISREAREKKVADLKLQQERDKLKRHEDPMQQDRDKKKRHEDLRRMAIQSAKRRGVHVGPPSIEQKTTLHAKLLEKHGVVKPQTDDLQVERRKTIRQSFCPTAPKQRESSHFPVSTAGGHFELLCDTVPLNLDDYFDCL